MNNTVFLFLNLAVLVLSLYGFGVVGSSECASGGYGGVLSFLNVVAVLFSVLELGFAHWLFFSFKSTSELPLAALNSD